MICKNCGKENENTIKFCENCGTKLEEEILESPAEESTETPAEEISVPENAEANEENAPEETPKKKSKKGLIIGIIVAVLAICGVVVALNFASVKNTVSKTFSSPEEYYKSVETKSLNSGVATISNAVDEIKAVASVETNELGILLNTETDATISLELGDEMVDYFSSMSDLDLSFLKKVDIGVLAAAAEDNTEIGLSLGIGGAKIDATVILDASDDTLYLSIPQLSDSAAAFEIKELADISLEELFAQTQPLMLSQKALFEALPDGKTTEKLINRYLDIVVDGIKNVEKSSKKVSVGSIEKDCTVLTATITEKDAMSIASSVLKTFKDDDETLNIFLNYMNSLAEITGEEFALDDIKKDLNEKYNDFSAEIKDKEYDDSENLEYITYVDNEGEIIGRRFSFEEASFEYICLEDGDKREFVISATDNKTEMFKATVSGTNKDGIFAGELKLNVSGAHILTVKVENFDTVKGLSGKFTVIPSASSKELLPLLSGKIEDSIGVNPADLGISLADISLVLEFNTSDTKANMNMALKSGDKNVIAFGINETVKTIEKIEKPAKSTKISNETGLLMWAATMKIDSFIDSIPEGLMALITNIMEASEDDEYYDDEYYYDDDEYYEEYEDVYDEWEDVEWADNPYYDADNWENGEIPPEFAEEVA
ncbi:MAG: zinc-ribbon domain-containing protein [Ruminococcaceae bacterium]|nr:zinc-ribbon domain-containing protein [Oscillospiraceae bacterium]